MFYREAGQYKTTYAADMAIFPIRQDRYGLALILLYFAPCRCMPHTMTRPIMGALFLSPGQFTQVSLTVSSGVFLNPLTRRPS